jgi:hypothetical protein
LALTSIVYNLIDISNRARSMRSRANGLLLLWLRRLESYGDTPPDPIVVQYWTHVQRVADLIKDGDLNVRRDRELLERFLRWVDHWEPRRKTFIHKIITWLKHSYPAEGLWEIVRFPPHAVLGQAPPSVATLDWPERAAFDHPGWSYIWEQLWAEQPDSSHLVELGRRWLWAAPAGQGAWTYVWEPMRVRSLITTGRPALASCPPYAGRAQMPGARQVA